MKLPQDSYQIDTARRQDIARRAEQEQLAEIARGERPTISSRVARLIGIIRRILPGLPSAPPHAVTGDQQKEIVS